MYVYVYVCIPTYIYTLLEITKYLTNNYRFRKITTFIIKIFLYIFIYIYI